MLMLIQVIKDELLHLKEGPLYILRELERPIDFRAGMDKLTHKIWDNVFMFGSSQI